LLVDNEPDIITIFTRGLAGYGFVVIGYTDPIHALADFKSGAYVAVLLDYKMPEMDGFTLYERMALIDSKPKYILMTAGDYKEKTGQGNPGMTNVRFIQKPVRMTRLAMEILNIISDA
jgi:CheY-like chemotaxis protein